MFFDLGAARKQAQESKEKTKYCTLALYESKNKQTSLEVINKSLIQTIDTRTLKLSKENEELQAKLDSALNSLSLNSVCLEQENFSLRADLTSKEERLGTAEKELKVLKEQIYEKLEMCVRYERNKTAAEEKVKEIEYLLKRA